MTKEAVHLLLADDDEGDRLIFLEAASELKTKNVVRTVNNGVQLMELIEGGNDHRIDLIFMDLNMPLKTGIECLQEVRAIKKFKNIFIAIYSTSGNGRDMTDALHHGANLYISKPNSFHKLKEMLEQTIAASQNCKLKSAKSETY